MDNERFRALPAIEKLVASAALARWQERLTHPIRVRLAQEVIEELRDAIRRGEQCPPRERIEALLEARFLGLDEGGIRKAINATGVVLHTNLGRAPLGDSVLKKMSEELGGYSLLELSAVTGERGDRALFAERLARLHFGASAALVVNNNAAAVFLVLIALAKGRGVLVSRGELVQIGGGFRLPDIFEASGARLVEVGTTNITTGEDYRRALRPENDIALLLKVHRSNFHLQGHVASPTGTELSRVAADAGVPFVVDLGSGALVDVLNAADREPTVAEVLREGASLVCISGDKLLGGPQAGIIAGNEALVKELRRSPLYRVLRLGKTELYLLEQTLLAYARGIDVPTVAALKASSGVLCERAQNFAERLRRHFPDAELVEGEGSAGGGTTPAVVLPAWLVAFTVVDAEAFTGKLLRQRPAVVLRKENKRLLVDLRTVLPAEEERLAAALEAAQ